MVDFNNEVTVGTPSANVVKILVLQARSNVFEALENYNKKLSQGIEADSSIVKARTGTWFLEHHAYLKRSKTKAGDKKLYEDYYELLFDEDKNPSFKEILQIIDYLNDVADTLRITLIDTKKQYDRSKIELDNEANEIY